ncbi:integrin alpha-D [Lampris incognitus]|uniref:integrin alpha-D n=1 Tax=Lampris incognitus TaxID=2546036 RepID=UPI0024B588E5|nr:integrin alpha-D [Lampris incognitus]
MLISLRNPLFPPALTAMNNLGCTLLLMCTVTITTFVSLAFNIDTSGPEIYEGEGKDFFGYKVLQFQSDQGTGVLVSAPLQQNGSGEVCRYVQGKKDGCSSQDIGSTEIEHFVSIKHFGLSLTKKSARSEFTACSPSLVHECYENHYLNSMCFDFDDRLRLISNTTPAFQECTKKTVDLVFLFDGSASMTSEEFNKNKVFIVEMMKSFQNSSIKFAAVQFSSDTRKVFDFNDYQDGRAESNLDKEPHMAKLTNTNWALKYVLESILENPAAGASPDATKVVVVITDGNPSDPDDKELIRKYDNKNIVRLVIGVKNTEMEKLRYIASAPKTNNTFQIEDYQGLPKILENFQRKIFNIEGSTAALSDNLGDELSQTGFSAIYHKDTLVLGAVGTNGWQGSLYELHGPDSVVKPIQDPDIKNNSYMGYALAAGEKNKTTLYFTGAPRFEHKGQVVLFRRDGDNWIVAQRLNGEQIGSYFGSEVSAHDVDSDTNTDFLLVGAPLFYQPREKREGQIYIYMLTDQLELKSVMTISEASQGRFGTTISTLADLNGDDLRDVAVGAPLEDDNRGAVYIYLGDKRTGIRDNFSQRIAAETINPQVQLFGQAIDGNIDLGDDGLTDIVVGSRGHAVVLRSRPVLSVSPKLSFGPQEISTENIDCLSSTNTAPLMGILSVCFYMTELTLSKAGAQSPGLNISYTLDVDPMRHTNRGFFSETDKGVRQLQSTVALRDKHICFKHPVHMEKCVKDILSPVVIRLRFSQHETKNTTAILNVDSATQSLLEVPFERNCARNDTCIAELEVDFNSTSPTLLVVDQDYFNVTVSLSNIGDDSYNTSLILHYPPGLSFSMMNVVKATKLYMQGLYSCDGLQDVVDEATCRITFPVYRSGASATFLALFRIIGTYEWNNTMTMTISGQSDNENSTRGSMNKTIPVQFQIDLAASVNEDTITYLSFTPEDSAPKTVVIIYEVKNLGLKALPVSMSLIIPTKLQHNFEMNNYHVSVEQSKSQCSEMANITTDSCSPEQNCKSIICSSYILDIGSTTRFNLRGEVAFRDIEEHVANMSFLNTFTGQVEEVVFKSFMEVHYDTQLYVLPPHEQETREVPTRFPTAQTNIRVEFIVAPDKMRIIGAGVGGGFLLLIITAVVMYKMGCFKRKTRKYYEEDMERTASQKSDQPDIASAAPGNEPETENQSEASAEEKLLDSKDHGNNGVPASPTGE